MHGNSGLKTSFPPAFVGEGIALGLHAVARPVIRLIIEKIQLDGKCMQGKSQPMAEPDRGRHPGYSSLNVGAGGPGSLAERSSGRPELS
jgi:hypothetical protein